MFFSFCLMSEETEVSGTKATCLLSVRTGAKNPNIMTPSRALPLDSFVPTILLSCLLRQFTKSQISLQGFSHPDLQRAGEEQFLHISQVALSQPLSIVRGRRYFRGVCVCVCVCLLDAKGSPPSKTSFKKEEKLWYSHSWLTVLLFRGCF